MLAIRTLDEAACSAKTGVGYRTEFFILQLSRFCGASPDQRNDGEVTGLQTTTSPPSSRTSAVSSWE